MPALPKVYFNGHVIPYEDARIHIDTPACKYGSAVFEGLRAYYNAHEKSLYVFRLHEHSERLVRSVLLMRMKSDYCACAYTDAVKSLLSSLRPATDLHVRQTVWVDGTGAMSAEGPVGMAVVATPSSRPAGFDTGIHMQISSWTRIADDTMPPRIKCVANYQNGRLASMQAKLDGYDNALLLNNRGKVAEAPGACFFFVKNGVPVTAPVTGGILESINRSAVIQMIREYYGMTVEEREIDRTEVYTADEAFLCGTAAEVTPIASVDRFHMKKPVGDLTRSLQEKLIGIARGTLPDHPEWRVKVY